jgi:hypothetical protein
MLNRRLLSALAVFCLIIASPVPVTNSAYLATCTGADPCQACKNCRYYRHCAKDSGTCGICKRR